MHYYIRQLLRWFCEKTKQQCSGKYSSGHAKVWCQKNAFHDDVCTDYSGKYFAEAPKV